MTMKQILDLRQKRAGVVAEARKLVELSEGESRDLTAEEQQQYDLMLSEASGYQGRIDRLERQLALEQDLERPTGDPNRPDPDNGEGSPEQRQGRASEEYAAAFQAYLRRGGGAQETRALQVDVDTQGGYLVPDQFMNDLIQDLDNTVLIRQWANTMQITEADSLGVPTLAADPADPIWTAEVGTGDEDTAMAFGTRQLRPHPLAKRIKVSRTLLRKAPGVEGLVRERLAYKFGVVMESAYLLGDGQGKPLGLFTASNDGIPTSRDIATGNATTAMTYTGLLNAKVALKQGYWGRARWLFNTKALVNLATLKDDEGHYIWQDNARDSSPATLLGLPVFYSEYVPSTFSTGLYVGLLGDFSRYWIVDALDMELQRLDELYAEKNQVGFIGRMESDGAPVLPEAFVRVKLG